MPGRLTDMNPIIFFVRRSVCRLTLILGIFCFIEAYVHSTDGTNPNVQFPWGHYVATLCVFGILLLAVAWLTWIGPRRPSNPQARVPGEQLAE